MNEQAEKAVRAVRDFQWAVESDARHSDQYTVLEVIETKAALYAALATPAPVNTKPEPSEDILRALRVAECALLMCKPCAEPECKAEQQEWLETAIESIRAALASNTGEKP